MCPGEIRELKESHRVITKEGDVKDDWSRATVCGGVGGVRRPALQAGRTPAPLSVTSVGRSSSQQGEPVRAPCPLQCSPVVVRARVVSRAPGNAPDIRPPPPARIRCSSLCPDGSHESSPCRISSRRRPRAACSPHIAERGAADTTPARFGGTPGTAPGCSRIGIGREPLGDRKLGQPFTSAEAVPSAGGH